MIVENVKIYDLIPTQITDMISKLNYALEIIKLRKTISKTAFTNSRNFSTNNMYQNNSGIDFDTVYADYHFTPSRTI